MPVPTEVPKNTCVFLTASVNRFDLCTVFHAVYTLTTFTFGSQLIADRNWPVWLMVASTSDSCHTYHEGSLPPRVMAVPSKATQLMCSYLLPCICAVIFSRCHCCCCFKLCVTDTQHLFWGKMNFTALKCKKEYNSCSCKCFSITTLKNY